MQARIHCWWCREGTSCWWCRQIQYGARRSDSLTNSPPYTSVDLGARSLVGGVDCNGPEKFTFLDLLVLLFFVHHRDVMHLHAFITLHIFVKPKIIWYKLYFILLVRFYRNPPLLYIF
jgi:hypothetical protein